MYILLSLAIALTALVPLVLGNTEIVNFNAVASQSVILPQASTWKSLTHDAPELLLRVRPAPLHMPLQDVCDGRTASRAGEPCVHEEWLVLDLDSPQWRKYSRFTLRVSWPAWSPVDFAIQIHPPDSVMEGLSGSVPGADAAAALPSTSRTMFARIRLVDTGIRPPASHPSLTPVEPDSRADPVAFMVLLEPLYLGVVPATVVPILLFMLPVVAVAALGIFPLVHRYLSKVAERARNEASVLGALSKKTS